MPQQLLIFQFLYLHDLPYLVNGVYLPPCFITQRALVIFHVQLYNFQYYNCFIIS